MTSASSAAATGLPMPRTEFEQLIEEAISLLDALDGDTDLEETGDLEPSLGDYSGAVDAELDDCDNEPSLGSPETWMQGGRQTNWAAGNDSDREVECEDEGAQCDEEPDVDNEPSLGSPEDPAVRWGAGGDSDLEQDVRSPRQARPAFRYAGERIWHEAQETKKAAARLEEIVSRLKGREVALEMRA